MAQAPCKNCKNRHFKCHGECDLYKDYVEQNNKERLERQKYSELNEVRKDTQTRFIKYNTQHRK